MGDRRSRPWKKLRVVVEVSVPPHSRATEKDLQYHVMENMPRTVKLKRALHANAHEATVRVKAFGPFWPMFLRVEKGMTNFKPKVRKEEDDAEYNGL